MKIGERIKKARQAEKLSLEVLGSKLGVSRQLVWQWEKGQSDPSKHIEALSEHLNRPIEYFYGTEPKPTGLAGKLALLREDQQELIERMIDQFIEQDERTIIRRHNVK